MGELPQCAGWPHLGGMECCPTEPPRQPWPAIDPHLQPTAPVQHDRLRAHTAAHHAKTRYPGAAGEVLAAEIRAYADLGCVAQPSAAVRRLIDELMR